MYSTQNRTHTLFAESQLFTTHFNPLKLGLETDRRPKKHSEASPQHTCVRKPPSRDRLGLGLNTQNFLEVSGSSYDDVRVGIGHSRHAR